MLKKIANKPHSFLFLLIPVILLLALFGIGSTIDIQMHNTYFVIDPFYFGILLSIILGGIGGLYWLVINKKLIDWITMIHVMVTSIGLLLITILTLKPELLNSTTGINYLEYYSTIIRIVSIATLIWLLCQLLFLVNLFIGISRSREK